MDADKIAHQLLETEEVQSEILQVFGKNIAGPAGSPDRDKLAALVFADEQKISALNSIIHPRVRRRIEELIGQYRKQDSVKAVILDVPLLLEVGWEKYCDKLIFVDSQPDIRFRRAKKAKGLNKKQIKIREKFQISLDKKRSIADNIIENNAGSTALAGQVIKIFAEFMS